MHLAAHGHEATVLEMRGEIAADSTFIHYRSMFQEAWEALPNFHAVTNARCIEITEDSVRYADADGIEHSVSADSVVISVGMKAKQEEALSFQGCGRRLHLSGDCKKPGTVQHAMRSAFAVASTI
jgi:thioredoxin reductase